MRSSYNEKNAHTYRAHHRLQQRVCLNGCIVGSSRKILCAAAIFHWAHGRGRVNVAVRPLHFSLGESYFTLCHCHAYARRSSVAASRAQFVVRRVTQRNAVQMYICTWSRYKTSRFEVHTVFAKIAYSIPLQHFCLRIARSATTNRKKTASLTHTIHGIYAFVTLRCSVAHMPPIYEYSVYTMEPLLAFKRICVCVRFMVGYL